MLILKIDPHGTVTIMWSSTDYICNLLAIPLVFAGYNQVPPSAFGFSLFVTIVPLTTFFMCFGPNNVIPPGSMFDGRF